jgi:hypothetical protein
VIFLEALNVSFIFTVRVNNTSVRILNFANDTSTPNKWVTSKIN